MSLITGIEYERGGGRAKEPGSEVSALPRLSFTEGPTRVWEVGGPVPFEIPEPHHEPALPELESLRIDGERRRAVADKFHPASKEGD
jgi:hypothetical protein